MYSPLDLIEGRERKMLCSHLTAWLKFVHFEHHSIGIIVVNSVIQILSIYHE